MAQENSTAAATVTVCCKLPHGINVDLYDMVDRAEAAPGGMQTVKRAELRRNFKRITLNGFSYAQNKAPKNPVMEGFGLTFNVPREPMAEWLKLHADQDYVKNGLIFIQDGRREVEAQLKDHASQRSGLERIDPKDKRQLGASIKPADAKA